MHVSTYMQVCNFANIKIDNYASMLVFKDGVCKDLCMKVFMYTCIEICKYAAIQECRYASMKVCRYVGIQDCNYAFIQVCIF